MFFSLIIPVYNRPDEIDELLESLTTQTYTRPFEVVIIEDGSTIPCGGIVSKYIEKLDLSYYEKPNSGPGDSRNYGMRKARGDYFIILDSDCLLPDTYLQSVYNALSKHYTDCFGGPDAALPTFTPVQKAINFAMTSFLTTGGIRGKSERLEKFQPRSFNMGLSRTAFEASGGFGDIHPGEDPDLSIRLWKLGFQTKLVTAAYVFHKRRIDWQKFYRQVNKFGKARPILDLWHPQYRKFTFLFPSLFMIGLCFSLIMLLVNIKAGLYVYALYFAAVFVFASVKEGSLIIGALSVAAVFIQFYGYGKGYAQSLFKTHLLGQAPQDAFPELFFKK